MHACLGKHNLWSLRFRVSKRTSLSRCDLLSRPLHTVSSGSRAWCKARFSSTEDPRRSELRRLKAGGALRLGFIRIGPCTCHTSSLHLCRAAFCWLTVMEHLEIPRRSVRVFATCVICTCLVLLVVASRSCRQTACAGGVWVTTPIGAQGRAHHHWGIQSQSNADNRRNQALEDSSVHPLLQRIFVSITYSWFVFSPPSPKYCSCIASTPSINCAGTGIRSRINASGKL